MLLYNKFASLLDMLRYLNSDTFAAIGNISQVAHSLYDIETDVDGMVHIKDRMFVAIISSVNEMQRIAEELGLDATLDSAQLCIDLLSRYEPSGKNYCLAKADAERLTWQLSSLNRNFSAQMQSRVVIIFDTRNSKYLTAEEPPFGKDVDDAFPKASEEISEASKCLALQRPTAVVFHLMRAMELAIQKLAEKLGVEKVEKVWGNLLSDIAQKIEAMPKGTTRDGWSACHTHLYHVKQAWRNDTMHPKTTYTEEQAETVFEAVRSFMEHLASMLD